MRICSDERPILALCGGIGGAELTLGLMNHLGERLTVAVDVGDDFTHCGLPTSTRSISCVFATVPLAGAVTTGRSGGCPRPVTCSGG